MASSHDNRINWWTAIRVFCLVGGLSIGSLAYLTPEWLGQYLSVDVASTLALILLLMLPVTMIVHYGGRRFTRAVRKSGRRASIAEARSTLPEWAKQQDLQFEERTQPGEVGTARGEYRGFRVLLDVDAGDIGARWRVELPDGELDVSTGPPPPRMPDELNEFDAGHARFDEIFQTRLTSGTVADVLTHQDSVASALVALWDAHRDALDAINIDEYGVVCFLEAESQYDIDTVLIVLDDMLDAMEQAEETKE